MGTSVGAMGPTVAEKVGMLWSSLPHIEAMAAITADWSTPEGVEDVLGRAFGTYIKVLATTEIYARIPRI